jgi:NADH-quinone oxidoreductase subunit K
VSPLEIAGLCFLALFVLGGALGTVLSKNLVHSVLWLALVLVATAGLYARLCAGFLAGAQVLLYAGGVITLAIFAVMLSSRMQGGPILHGSQKQGRGALAALAVGGLLVGGRRRGRTRALVPGRVRAALRGALGAARRGDDRRAHDRAQGGPVSDVQFCLLLAALLFAIGVFGLLTRRNAIGVLLSIELMANAVNINLVAFSRIHGGAAGQVFALFAIALTVAEVSVGLALVILMARQRRTIDIGEASDLHG